MLSSHRALHDRLGAQRPRSIPVHLRICNVRTESWTAFQEPRLCVHAAPFGSDRVVGVVYIAGCRDVIMKLVSCMRAAPFGSDRADGVLYEASGWPEIGAFLFGAPSNSAAPVPPANIVKARAFLFLNQMTWQLCIGISGNGLSMRNHAPD